MADNQPQAVQPVRPVVDWAAQLADCVRPLTNEGFPVATWTTATVTRSFITVQKFIDTVKILTQEADREVFLRLISKGNSREAWQTQGTCTPKQLYLYCTWLKSSEGAAFLNECRRARTLEKKAAPGQTLADVALQSALDAQLNELSIKEKAFRNRMELELQDLRRRIVLKEREKNEGLRAFAADYQPAAAYAPMDDLTLGEKCYELYLAECSAKGTVAMELDDAVLADIRAQYGNTAISLHKTDFLRDERRREEIRVWIEEKILELEEAGDQRQANSFRSWLATTGGEVLEEVRAEVEERAVAAGSHRRRPKRARADVDPANILPEARRRRVDPRNLGPQVEAAARPAHGEAGPGAIPVEQQRPDNREEAAQGGQGGGDPHRQI